MRLFALVTLPLLLSACLEEKEKEKNLSPSACVDIITSQTERPIKVDKCNGDTWMLIRTTLVDDMGKETGTFTYRWMLLSSTSEEPELSLPR